MDCLSLLLSIIQDFSIWSYFLIALITFGESLAFVGSIIPGGITIIAGGFLAAQGVLNVSGLFLFAVLGAILGDSFSFYLGKRKMITFREGNKLFKPGLLEKGENYFKKHFFRPIYWLATSNCPICRWLI